MQSSGRRGTNRNLVRLTISNLFFVLCLILYIPVFAQGGIQLSYDRSGNPIVEYGCQGHIYIGPQRNPITVAKTANSNLESYNRTYDTIFLIKFLNNSDWLVENAASMDGYSLFPYQFYWPAYDLEPPWYSGMAQALGIEVLIKAHQITNNPEYLDTAKKLLNAFLVEVKDGGVTYKTTNDGWWYEGYARPGAKETRILNGHTFALLGIYEYYQYTKDPAAKYLFDQGIIALKKNLPRYEYAGEGEYSTYDILNNTIPAPPLYHVVQSAHLGELYNITGESIFGRYYKNWTNFSLDEKVAQEYRLYYDPSNIDPNFVETDENFIPLDSHSTNEPKISRIENSSKTNLPLKFRIEGDNGNRTAQFSSDWFYYVGRNINVTMNDKIKSHTNLNLSFIVLSKGLSEEKKITFLHGPSVEGWKDDLNYFVMIDSNSSKSVNATQLFGRDDNYMLLKRMIVEIPKNACVNSMEFTIDLK